MIQRSFFLRALLPVLLIIPGCMPNETGRTAAIGTGQLLEPPAPRQAELEAPCGAPADDGRLLRQPYLQGVGTDRASILFTAEGLEATVEIRTLAGDEVGTYQATVDPTSFLSEGEQYIASVDGLEPGQTYCYTVHAAGEKLAGPHGIRTAPDAMDVPVDLIVFGDSGGGGPDQYALAEQMPTVPLDLILTTGDVAYPDGTLTQFEENFFGVYAPLLAHVPVFPASGNHDYRTADAGPYREVFALPGDERWYSFDWGPLHVVSLDTELNGAEQANWLEQDLATNERPWTVVTAHKGPHSSGPHGDNLTFQELYGELLTAYQVPLVLSGHDHHYERTQPIDGVTYVVTGGGGYGVRDVAEWGQHTAFAEGVVHFVYLHVTREKLTLHAIDAEGREFDAIEIRT